jgi:hypothetical protein
VVGAAYAFGLLGILSIGIFVLPCAVLGTWYLARRPPSLKGLPGALSGAGLPLLYVALLNRDGPGTVCTVLGDGAQRCDQEMSPWPWLVAGLLFVLLGPAVYVVLGSRRRSR